MRNRKRKSKKKYADKSKSKGKFIFIFSITCLFIILTGGTLYFAKYNKTEDKVEVKKTEIKTQGRSIKKKKIKKKSNKIEKGIPRNMEFTFFETLTRSENYTSGDLLNNKKKTNSKIKKKKNSKTNRNQRKSKSKIKKNERLKMKTAKSKTGSKFIIQVSSFKDRLLAERLREKLVSKGYQALITTTEASDKSSWHKVRIIGGFKNKESALKLVNKIKLEENITALIVSSNGKK